MTAASVGSGVIEADSLDGAAVVGRHFLFLDGHGQFGMTILFGHAVGAEAHDLSESLTLAGHLGRIDHCLCIAEPERETDLFFLDAAHFKQFHGAGNGSAHGDRVKSILVAQEVRLADRAEVVDAAVGAE